MQTRGAKESLKRRCSCKAGYYTTGVTREEIEQAVAQILQKREGGEKLTAREETILAYGYYAAQEQRMVFKVPDRSEEE